MAQVYQAEEDKGQRLAAELNSALEEVGRLKRRLETTEKDLDSAFRWGAGLSLGLFTALIIVSGLFLAGVF